MKYKKKPVIIEAVQWKDGEISEVTDWIREGLNKLMPMPNQKPEPKQIGAIMQMGDYIHIATLEGEMFASDGDYIIRGVKGELYPCKPDIFKMTYEKID